MPRGGARPGAGRKPKPVELKVLEGTWRKDRDGEKPRQEAPEGLVEFPSPPPYLTAPQKALWEDLRKHCGGWVKPGDWLAVNGVVLLSDRLRAVHAAYEKGKGKKYGPTLDEIVHVETKLLRELRGFLALLGLSPADRTKFAKAQPPAKPKQSKWAGIISGVS